MSKLERAIYYISHGFKVFPLRDNSKEPRKDWKWKEHSSTDQAEVVSWFEQYPNANVGVCTNSKLLVLDIDNKDEKNGDKSFQEISQDQGLDTLTVITPNGGRHLYFENNSDVKLRSRIGFLDGLDLKAEGGYVVGAGSSIDGREYSVVNPDAVIRPIPDWLKHCLTTVEEPREAANDANWGPNGPNSPLSDELERINPDLPYEDWIRVIFICLDAYSHTGETVHALHAWSREGQKFNHAEFIKKLRSHNPNHPNKAGIGTLRHIQKQYPWKRCISLPRISAEKGYYKELVARSFGHTLQILGDHGNQLSDSHEAALASITEGLAHGALSDEPSRIAYPLPTGMGKTTAVKGFIQAIVEMNLPISILVAAESIEQHRELYEDLLKLGLPKGRLGIYHHSENKYPDVESISEQEIDNCQFLLIAHSRLTNRWAHEKPIMFFHGERRDLVVWDESLITTNGDFIPAKELVGICADWRAQYQYLLDKGRKPSDPELYAAFYKFLGEAESAIREATDDRPIKLPAFEQLGYEKVINSVHKSEWLRKLVEFSKQGEMREISTRQGRSMVQFTVTVPDEIDKISILDASAEIRKLVQYDKTISVFSLNAQKDYSTNVIRYCKVGSSKLCLRDEEYFGLYLRELGHLLTHEIPEGEEVLILTFKDDGKSATNGKGRIKGFVESLGLGFKDRVHITTWGAHKGINKYRDVKYVITIGVLYRDYKELAASVIGQNRDLEYPLRDSELHEVQCTEQADLIYQGLSRGNSRTTINGQAGEMVVYLFHRDPVILRHLKQVMPGVRIERYEPRFLIPGSLDWWNISEQIQNYLGDYKENKISIRKLVSQVSPGIDTNSKTWRKALSDALDAMWGAWERKDKSLVKAEF